MFVICVGLRYCRGCFIVVSCCLSEYGYLDCCFEVSFITVRTVGC